MKKTKLQLNTVKNILRNTNCVKEFISVSTNCAQVMENHFIYKVQIHNSFIKAHFDAAILAVTVLKSKQKFANRQSNQLSSLLCYK